MTTPRIIYAKHLVASPAHYPQLAKGEPCKKGETAARSGCTPASGKGGGVGSDWRVTGEDPHWTGGPAYKEPPDDPKMISAWEKAVSSPEDFSREELLNLLSWNERWQEDYSDESMIEEFGKPLTHADAAEMIRELEAEGGGGAKESQPAPAGGGARRERDQFGGIWDEDDIDRAVEHTKENMEVLENGNLMGDVWGQTMFITPDSSKAQIIERTSNALERILDEKDNSIERDAKMRSMEAFLETWHSRVKGVSPTYTPGPSGERGEASWTVQEIMEKSDAPRSAKN